MIKRSRQEAVFLASSMIDRSVETAQASLETAERQAKSVALRLQLSDALAALSRHRAAMRSSYPALVDDAIGEALHAAGSDTAAPDRAAGPELALALVEDEEVSRFVEASRVQQLTLPVVEQALGRLDSLMSSALGLPVVRAELNPMRPDVMCGTLLQLIESVPETPETRSHWTRHLAPPFAQELRRLYEALTKLLEEQGVEEARYRLKLTEGGALAPGVAGGAGNGGSGGGGDGAAGAGGSGSAASGGGGASGDAPSDAEQVRQRRALFPRMNDLAQARPVVPQSLMRDFLYRPQWVADNDEPLPAAYYEAVSNFMQRAAAEPVASFDEAAQARQRMRDRALSVVDRPPREVAVDMPLAPEQWGEEASPAARTRTLMELKGKASKISQALGLDAVRTLVGQVAGDERVLAPVREAFVALEPALLRMAMADPRFFGDEHHPARRLVEGVAQRSFKYNDEYAEEFEQFMVPVREVVRQLNARPDGQAQDFADRLAGLEAEWQALDAGEKEAEQLGLRSMHFAQERQALADKVAWEFSLRSDLEGVPHIVADFLFNDWSLVIAHAQMTDTRGQLDPGGYLAVVTDLLWSVKREALKQPARVFEVVPGVIGTLRRGLQMLGKEQAETQAFFDALMRYHDPVLRLRRVRSARDAEASGFARLDGESTLLPLDSASIPVDSEQIPLQPPKPRAAEQPWLARQELAAAGFDEVDSAPAPLETPFSDLEPAGGQRDDAGFARTQPFESDASPVSGGAAAGAGPADAGLGSPMPGGAARPASGASSLPPAQSEEEIKAWTRATLERMRTGDWFDLRVRGHWRRAQLSWTSDNRALFMFVSRGGRPHSMTRRTCEKLIRDRTLRPLDRAAVVDKALRGLADGPVPSREGLEVATT